MNKAINTSLAFLLTLSAFGCGYFLAGQWEDDPDNWKRAFRSTKPDDVRVIHSLYWRAPHFTYEAGYFFEIASHDGLRKQLFDQNDLSPIAVPGHDFFPDTPKWFAPKTPDDYDAWGYAEDPGSNFRVLIDRDTGNIFLADYQL